MNRTTSLVFASACLLSVACSDSDRRPLSAEEYDEVAQAISGAVVMNGNGGEIHAVSDSVSIAIGRIPFGFRVSGSGQIEGQHGALDFSYQATCRDAAGREQKACDNATDRADLSVAWSGQLELPRFRLETERDGDWALSGLQGDTAVFAGTSDFRVAVETEPFFGPALRTYDLAYAAEYEEIKVDVDARRIVGGRAHLAATGELTATGNGHDDKLAFDVDAVVTFDGDGTATLVIDATNTFAIDLRSGRVTRR